MSGTTSARPTNQLEKGTATYENVRVVITPEGPRHFEVQISDSADERTRHAVERVVVNTAEVLLDGPIWFIDAELDVGVPICGAGDTAWVWV